MHIKYPYYTKYWRSAFALYLYCMPVGHFLTEITLKYFS